MSTAKSPNSVRLVRHFDASPERVWGIVTDHSSETAWRHELTGVWRIEGGGRARWQEQYWSHQRIDLETLEQASRAGQGGRLVSSMSFHALPVLAGGVRILDVAPEGGGTRVTMREEKVIRVPPFRTWARLFVAPQLGAVTADRYLTQLAARLNATPRFE